MAMSPALGKSVKTFNSYIYGANELGSSACVRLVKADAKITVPFFEV
jgi:hypothetical protein